MAPSPRSPTRRETDSARTSGRGLHLRIDTRAFPDSRLRRDSRHARAHFYRKGNYLEMKTTSRSAAQLMVLASLAVALSRCLSPPETQ